MSYQGLIGSNGWGGPIPIPQHNGSYAKGGNPTLMGKNLKTDPGGKACKDSDWAFKTNEGDVAKNIP